MGIKSRLSDAASGTYYGVGYSTRDGVSAGAQSINTGDNYSADTADSPKAAKIRRNQSASKFSKALVGKRRKNKSVDIY